MEDSGGLDCIQKLVINWDYSISEKVKDALDSGFFTLEDIETSILTGYVHKRTNDRLKQSIGNKVYHIIGRDTHGYEFYTQGKIIQSEEGKIYFFITAHPSRQGEKYE